MAPEVFRHEPYNSRVDVYSFSMIVYQLFEVRPPAPAPRGVRVCVCAEGWGGLHWSGGVHHWWQTSITGVHRSNHVHDSPHTLVFPPAALPARGT